MEGCSKCNGGDFRSRPSKALRSKREGNMETNHKVLWAAVETKSPKLYARDLTQIVHASGGLVYDARVCRAGEDEWNLQLKGKLDCPDHVLHRAKLQALMLILDNSVYRHSSPSPKRRRIRKLSHEYNERPRDIVLARKWSTIESSCPARPPLFEFWERDLYGDGFHKVQIHHNIRPEVKLELCPPARLAGPEDRVGNHCRYCGTARWEANLRAEERPCTYWRNKYGYFYKCYF